eukprot:SAG22_NODE_2329_length_2708_cov_1.905328_2_plen_161_part_00
MCGPALREEEEGGEAEGGADGDGDEDEDGEAIASADAMPVGQTTKRMERKHRITREDSLSSDAAPMVWTEEEHARSLEALQFYHRDWPRVAKFVGTKTLHQTKMHASKWVDAAAAEASLDCAALQSLTRCCCCFSRAGTFRARSSMVPAGRSIAGFMPRW